MHPIPRRKCTHVLGPSSGGRCPIAWLSVALGCVLLWRTSRAEDTVIVSRADGRGETRRKGEVLDYNGTGVVLRSPSGQREQIPAERVVRIETGRLPEHETGDRLRTEGRYEDALISYRKAVKQEPREWVQRQILAEMVGCYQNLGQFDTAGSTFLIIARIDPATPLFHVIPLAWKPHQPSPELARQASAWMGEEGIPVAGLLGASWLLATNQREEALKKLRALAALPDSRVARLAEAQQWRTRMATASEKEIDRWGERVAGLEVALRAGPYFVMGQTLAQQRVHAQAALTLLRVPILYPACRDLAAEALLSAGEQLELAGEGGEASNVYRELVEKYVQHPVVPLARERLEKLSEGK